jgi:hypothetical protein
MWNRFTLAGARSASVGGGIAAVARVPNSMEVWWVGTEASVQGAYWYEGQSWKRYELAPAGSASGDGSITAVSRIPDSMEVWWVGTDASVRGASSHPYRQRKKRNTNGHDAPQTPALKAPALDAKEPAQGKTYRESAIGPKQTFLTAPQMSAFGGKAMRKFAIEQRPGCLPSCLVSYLL